MKKKTAIVVGTVVLIAATVACSQSPATPSAGATGSSAASSASTSQSSPDAGKIVTNSLTGVSLTTPFLTSPSDGQAIKFADQPVTLTVKNAITTGAASTYTFQVATDAGFTTVVVTPDGVAQGANGSTSVVLPKLAGATAYFWRARATSSGTVGLFSTARTFNVGPEVVLQAPVPSSPGFGSSVSGNLTLVVNNVQRSGPVTAITYRFDLSDSSSFSHALASVTAITYRFDLSDSSSFSHALASVTVPEQAGSSTSFSPSATLGAGTYYWRAQAFDSASGVSSPVSAVWSFSYQPFNMSQATIVNSPFDLATWGETAKITSVTFTPDGVAFLVDFDKRDGPDRWPDTPFGSGSIEYTLGMCLNINGQWYCSAAVQFWFGRDLGASGIPSHVSFEWFYDFARWGPMAGYQPQEGETVGLFVCAGNCRNNIAGDNSYVKERSNVAFVPWSNSGNGSYTFSHGLRIKRSGR